MRFAAASCTSLRPVLGRPAREGAWLGACGSALYLSVGTPAAVLAILSHDAAWLPGGLRLATTSAELPLTMLVAPGPGVRTTALSAVLLAHAARGECAAELASAAAALAGREAVEPAFGRLLAVGHTSGAALSCGLLAAARRAHRCGHASAPRHCGHRTRSPQ